MSLCCCESTEKNRLVKELWRLRLNWMFVAAMSVLNSVSNTSISSSFHQFVINPRRDDANGTWSEDQFGLGQSESFYSWLIAVFNFGSVFSAILCGFLVKCLPYWYLFASALVAHTVGFILYAITYEGWLILISKFLSGYFLGVQWCLGISYTAKSSEEYVAALEELGEQVDDGSVERVKRYVFSSHTVGVALGFIVGPGAAVIFAQFPIDQFKAIAWYNVAFGTAMLILQVLIFRGEAKCNRLSRAKDSCRCVGDLKTGIKNGALGVFIVVTFLFFIVASAMRFGYFETLFNPVLSDSFGFDERDSSYYFLVLVIPYIGGVITLVVLQRSKLSNQLIAIIGVLMTCTACLLSTDWQAIPYDSCTEYSPFHHPELNYNSSLDTDQPETLTELHLLSSLTLNGHTVALPVEFVLYCRAKYCDCDQHSCLYYTSTDAGYIVSTSNPPSLEDMSHSVYTCSQKGPTTDTHQPLKTLCVQLYENTTEHLNSKDTNNSTASVQMLSVLSRDQYNISKENCKEAIVTSGRCHWIPSSTITVIINIILMHHHAPVINIAIVMQFSFTVLLILMITLFHIIVITIIVIITVVVTITVPIVYYHPPIIVILICYQPYSHLDSKAHPHLHQHHHHHHHHRKQYLHHRYHHDAFITHQSSSYSPSCKPRLLLNLQTLINNS